MAKIHEIEGIGPVYAEKLGKVGIATTDDLLDSAADPKGRKSLADTTAIEESRILKWVNMADLFRVKGIGEQYSELLEAAGVDTVKELRTRKPENLLAKMKEVNDARNLVKSLPSLSSVEAWVEFAKTIEPKVSY